MIKFIVHFVNTEKEKFGLIGEVSPELAKIQRVMIIQLLTQINPLH
jgi:hypothetical protein